MSSFSLVERALPLFRRMVADPIMPFSDRARRGFLDDPRVTSVFTAGLLMGYANCYDRETWDAFKRFEEECGLQVLEEYLAALCRDGFDLLKREQGN